MRKLFLTIILGLAFGVTGSSAAFAGDKMWVDLYLAENTPPPANAKVAPEHLLHRLRKVFGFEYYELHHAQAIKLHDEWPHWVMARKDFFLRVEPLPHRDGEPRQISWEIYKDGFIVANGKFEPSEDTPLFINGPDFKQGRFIFVLESRD